jgi:predicted XRE-type DNA-binding protein
VTDCIKSWGWPDGKGYFVTRTDGKLQFVHRLVYAEHHEVELKPELIIRHLCNNPWCIEITHLAEGSQKDNMHDAIRSGTHSPHTRKITREDAEEIRRLHKKTNKSQEAIGKMFGINQRQVSKIVNGLAWRRV